MFETFQKKYVINLRHRTDRRRETELELAQVNCANAEFFSAIRPLNAGNFGSIGERGCFMSHLAILKAAVRQKNVLVMEDDIQFSRNFAQRSGLLDLLPTDWDIFYGGYGQLPQHRNITTEPGLKEVDNNTQLIGTHCYAVNGPAISKLIQAYECFLSRKRGHCDGGPMPVDGAMNVARKQLGLRTFIIIPPLASQRSSRTDIGNIKWFDSVPVVKSVVPIARYLKNIIKH